MARPSKPVDVLSRKIGKDEKRKRKDQETKLKGASDHIIPSDYLNAQQKAYFMEIVNHYKASGILSNLDVSVIEQYAKARFALDYIDAAMVLRPELMMDKDMMVQREKWQKSFFRSMSELGLSPASRSKLGNINAQAKQQDEDPLLQVLKFNRKET